jgi:hypothetical protein
MHRPGACGSGTARRAGAASRNGKKDFDCSLYLPCSNAYSSYNISFSLEAGVSIGPVTIFNQACYAVYSHLLNFDSAEKVCRSYENIKQLRQHGVRCLPWFIELTTI